MSNQVSPHSFEVCRSLSRLSFLYAYILLLRGKMQKSSPVWRENSPAQYHPMLHMIFHGKFSPTLPREIIAQYIAKNTGRMDLSLRSCCPVVTGLWAVEEHHRVYTADWLLHIVCLRHPDRQLLLALLCARKEEHQQKSGYFLTAWHCAFLLVSRLQLLL